MLLLLSASVVGGCGATLVERLVEQDRRFEGDRCAAIELRDAGSVRDALLLDSGEMGVATGVHMLEDGGGALSARAWLSDAAGEQLDVQYFIFSADNVGLIAADHLLRAAERGVRVRVLVDDLLVHGDADFLWALDQHPSLEIRVYNPIINIGKNIAEKLTRIATDFRGINQRMHNKTFLVDGLAAITGGRNVADEYYDFDAAYNFRDRDVLLLGGVVAEVQRSFQVYWEHRLSVPIEELMDRPQGPPPEAVWHALHQYACHPDNFWPTVRERIHRVPERFAEIRRAGGLRWVRDVEFVWDPPGKSDRVRGLGGGSITTTALASLVRSAKRRVLIQTPYLVTTELGKGLFREATERGVEVLILTNSLASTDGIEAFSGYARDREALLRTGAKVFEFRPDARVRQEAMTSARVEATGDYPRFGQHAKTMVIDERVLVVGTFNVDPRSANLNTECVAVIPSPELAEGVARHIEVEMQPDNAWPVTEDDSPDRRASFGRRVKLWWSRIFPKSIL